MPQAPRVGSRCPRRAASPSPTGSHSPRDGTPPAGLEQNKGKQAAMVSDGAEPGYVTGADGSLMPHHGQSPSRTGPDPAAEVSPLPLLVFSGKQIASPRKADDGKQETPFNGPLKKSGPWLSPQMRCVSIKAKPPAVPPPSLRARPS